MSMAMEADLLVPSGGTGTGTPKQSGPGVQRLRRVLLAVLPLLAVLGLWELWLHFGSRSTTIFLPRPSDVASAAGNMISSTVLFSGAGASLLRVLIGVALAAAVGVPLGTLMGISRLWRDTFHFSFELIRPVPIAAWVPLVIVVLGIGNVPAEFLIFLGALYPVVVNTMSGIEQVNRIHLRGAAMLGAGRFRTAVSVIFPSSLPSVLAGIRLSIGLAWWCDILAELLAVHSGLGYQMVTAQATTNTATIVVLIAAIGVIGYGMDAVARMAEKRLLRWR